MQPKLAFGVEPARRRFSLRLARYEALAETLEGLLAEGQGPLRVLDVGVGRGRTWRYCEARPGAERLVLTGVDLNLPRLQTLYGRERWRLARVDLHQGLPFRDQSFEVVICEQLLEHLAAPEALIAELTRVLRPGGVAIVGVPTFPPGWRAFRASIWPRVVGESDHQQAFSLGSLCRLLEEGGLKVRSARGFRLASGGALAPLEDRRWFWRLSAFWGRTFPGLCVEVQVVARRTGADLDALGAPPHHGGSTRETNESPA